MTQRVLNTRSGVGCCESVMVAHIVATSSCSKPIHYIVCPSIVRLKTRASTKCFRVSCFHNNHRILIFQLV